MSRYFVNTIFCTTKVKIDSKVCNAVEPGWYEPNYITVSDKSNLEKKKSLQIAKCKITCQSSCIRNNFHTHCNSNF